MRSVNIGNKNTYRDWGLYLTSISIGMPSAKTHYVDVPFADGSIDLTQAFTGDVSYQNRTLSFTFDMMIGHGERAALIQSLASHLHGQKHKIVLMDDQEFYYVGRLSINQYKTDRNVGQLTIDADCEPYRYKQDPTEVLTTLEGTSTRAAESFLTGGNISAWATDMEQVKTEAAYMNLATLTIPVRFEIPTATSSEITVNQGDIDKYNQLASKLSGAGHKYIFEPYPYIAGGAVGETEYNPTDVNAFFANWEAKIKETIPKLNFTFEYSYVCSNLVHLESQVAKWTSLRDGLKASFPSMKLMYRTNWWLTATWAPETIQAFKDKLNNPIFGVFDVIAIASYFELHDGDSPSQAELRAALKSTQIYGRGQNIVDEIKQMAEKWGKPIFLGELNCASRNRGAAEPWNNAPSTTTNNTIQEALLSAYVEEFKGFSWFLGFSVFCIGDSNTTFSIWNTTAKDYVRSLRVQSTSVITCKNGRKKVIPTFTFSAPTTIKFGNKIMAANAGTHRFTNVILSEGNNIIEATGLPGETVKITYQEGEL